MSTLSPSARPEPVRTEASSPLASPLERVPTVVVGGGLAGLSCALELARAGAPVVLLERAGTLGGRARTQVREGLHLNLGPHALYLKGEVVRALDHWGLELELPPVPVRGLLVEREGSRPFPTTPAQLATLPGASMAERLALVGFFGGLALGRGAPAGVSTVGEWARRLGGLPGELLLALCRLSTYANDPEHLDADAVARQLGLSLGGVAYLHGGWQELVALLARAAREAGAELRCGVSVEELEREPASVDRGSANAGTGEGSWLLRTSRGPIRAQQVVLATPPAAGRALLGPELGPRCLPGEPRPARAACLDLALRRLPRPETTFALGLHEPAYLSVHSAVARLAPPGVALVHLAWYREGGDVAHRRAQLEAFMDRVQPGWREELIRARYLPDLLVSGDVVQLGGRVAVDSPERPGLLLAGDHVGEVGMLADAAVASGRQAARCVLERQGVLRAA